MKNVIMYFKIGMCKENGTVYYIGGSGYEYDINIDGKKKLAKKVPTTNGYCFDNKIINNTVVIENIITTITTNYKSAQDCMIDYFNLCLDSFKDDKEYNNIMFITKSTFINNLIKCGLNKLKKQNFVFNKNTLNESLVIRMFELLDLYKNRKVIFNINDWVDGGQGPKMTLEICGLCNTICQLSDEVFNKLDKVSLKEYESPNNDFNKIVNSNRWYFYTGSRNAYYDDSEGFRKYYFGKIEKKKAYYGKLTPDVNYSLLYTKEPIKHLDKLRDYTVEHIHNDNGLLYAGITSNINSKAISRIIDSLPGVPQKDRLIIPFKVGAQEDPTLIEMINPPGLSFRIINDHLNLNDIMKDFLNERTKCRYKDITDLFYTIETNGKGVEKLTLNKDFKQSTEIIKCEDEHPNAVIPVKYNLVVGTDTPTRVNFNSVTDVNVKVYLVTDTSNKNGSYVYTLVVTDDFLYLSRGGANLRILNLKELGEK